MNIDANGNAAKSSSERVLRHLETRVPDCNLAILSRALLINSLGKTNGIQLHYSLAVTPLALAHQTRQCSAEAESEWENVGGLIFEPPGTWLRFDNVDLHLSIYREQGPTRPLRLFGRVNVPVVELIMWPTWIHACRIPALPDQETPDVLPAGLERCHRCQEPPCRHRFYDVTLRTRLLQGPAAVRELLRYGWAVLTGSADLGPLCRALVIIFMVILEAVVLAPALLCLFVMFKMEIQ